MCKALGPRWIYTRVFITCRCEFILWRDNELGQQPGEDWTWSLNMPLLHVVLCLRQTEICQRSERSLSSRFVSAANLRVSAERPLMASLWRLQADHQEHNLPPCWAAASVWINHPSQLEVKLFDFMCDPNKTASPEWRWKWCCDGEKRVHPDGADLLHAFMLLFLLHDVTFYLLYTFQVITFIHISPALLAKS